LAGRFLYKRIIRFCFKNMQIISFIYIFSIMYYKHYTHTKERERERDRERERERVHIYRVDQNLNDLKRYDNFITIK